MLKMELVSKVKSVIIHPLIAGPLGGGLIILLVYLDSKYRDVKRDKQSYIKLFIMSSLVLSTITYFVSAEHNKIDDFLDQNYDTSNLSFLPKSKKGGFEMDDQPEMIGPGGSITKIMDNLPKPGTFVTPEKGGNSSNITMKILEKPTNLLSKTRTRKHK
jgi:hypothetical protein